ncbi:site-specific integrase [Dactylosporangium roseum]|uniref:site-specific integrase n=1 Tax=Dactylosporangium roseum TaxID=47989 RepID=UPI0021B1EB62|nr:site-specific integrase [Dactylosporangium roseum]
MRRSSPAPVEQMIAALVPAPLPRARPPRPPLPDLPAPRTGPDHAEAHLDVGRLDPSGRISARALLHLLGWTPGHRVTFDITAGVITATSDPAGRHTIGATGLLATPAPIRQCVTSPPATLSSSSPNPAVTCCSSTRPEPSPGSSPVSSPPAMPADRQRLDAAWTALAELGVTLADLQRDARPAVPTFDEYLPQVLAAAGPGALRVYRSYWQRMTTAWATALLLRLHTETACRRAGALGLRLQDLDADRGLLLLREKGGTVRWLPISLNLAGSLVQHAAVRGALLPTDALLRYRNGRALTSRRYDELWRRIGRHLPWVAAQGITAHWLRHTTLTWVERHFGYGTARAYAGHTDTTGPATTTYIRADLQAVALAAMTGQPHPLAHPIADHRVVYDALNTRAPQIC